MLEARRAALKRHHALDLETSPLFIRHVERPRGIDALPRNHAGPAGASPSLEGTAASYRLDRSEGVALSGLPRGAVVRSLHEAIAEHPELARNLLTAPLQGDDTDKLGNLARALATNGVVIYIPADERVVEPILVRQAPPSGALFTRVVVSLAAGAKCTVVEQQSPDAGLLSSSLQLHVGAGAQLRYGCLQNGGKEAVTLSSREARVDAGASLDWSIVNVGSRLAKTQLVTELAGPGSSVRGRELAFGGGEQRIDSTAYIRHGAGGTTSDYLAKAVHSGKARSYVKGRIGIAKAAADSDSFLGQYAMLLSKESRCIAIPSLEIECMAVKRAKHAAAVAQIDPEQVFYLMSRGLTHPLAARTIVRGFLDPMLDSLPFAPLVQSAGEAVDAGLGEGA